MTQGGPAGPADGSSWARASDTCSHVSASLSSISADSSGAGGWAYSGGGLPFSSVPDGP